ncbi:MAG: single-stranded DNA-binding protein [Methanobrevibacter sp.]|nr:single-stranded DNA-binding protein [Methanobrevibacter sp.]
MEEKFNEFELRLKWFSGYISEPNIQYFEKGSCKTSFSIPLKKQKDDDPCWLNCVAWNKLAEQAGDIKKGELITVGGYFSEREYNDKKYLDFNVKVIA